MLSQFTKQARNFVVCTAMLTSAVWAPTLWAHGGAHGPGGHSPPPAVSPQQGAGSIEPTGDLQLDPRRFQPRHGGQVSATKWHFFEVVYLPQETRLYLYSPSQRPLYAGSVKGHLVMRVKGNPAEFRFPLKPVIDASMFGRDMGHLAAAVDVTRVRDGDMSVAFDLKMSSREEPEARFTQTFALTRPQLPVKEVRVTQADWPSIRRQRFCPVMQGTELGAHGAPIKLMVDGQALFVCCQGCVDEVRKNPRRHLQNATASITNRPSRRARPAVFWASQNDNAAVRAQRFCPVTDRPLEAYGRAIKVVVDEHTIFVCCDKCIDDVVKSPGTYFRKVSATAPPQAGTRQSDQVRHRQEAFGYATTADRFAVEAQGVCPVMNQPLGSRGTPIKVTIGGRSIFVCCHSCVDRVRDNPALYFGLATRQRPSTPATGGSCCSGNSSKKRSCCQ